MFIIIDYDYHGQKNSYHLLTHFENKTSLKLIFNFVLYLLVFCLFFWQMNTLTTQL